MSGGFGTYLSDVQRLALLSPQQEQQLGYQVQAGIAAGEILESDTEVSTQRRLTLRRQVRDGEVARRKLIEANLRLVVYLARRYQGRGVPFADLVQEGNVGLMSAVARYKPDKGFRLSTYAGSWIHSALRAALADQMGAVRLPAHLVTQASQLYRAEQEFQREKHRAPTLSELARRCGIDEAQIVRIRGSHSYPLSLETPLGEDLSVSDLLSDDEGSGPDELLLERARLDEVRRAAEEALAYVADERVRELLRLRFGLVDGRTRTLAELSGMFGVTKERLRLIEVRTLSRLRRSHLGEALRDLIQDS